MFSHSSHARPRGIALAVSIAWHAAIGLAAVWVMRSAPVRERVAAVRADPLPSIVWVEKAGDADGGGTGGNESTLPPQRARRVGADRLTVPVAKPPNPLSTEKPQAAPDTGLQIPAVNLASAFDSLPGAIHPPPGLPEPGSLGPGLDGGVGGGRGTGEGHGPEGAGLGNGGPRGAGDGAYRIGSGGLTPPIPLYRGAPRYTSEAVQARVQGSVFVECIVRPTGRCTDFRVVRSIQPPYGLDREAIVAAAAWRFKPGTIAGEQVPVLVTIEVAFSIR